MKDSQTVQNMYSEANHVFLCIRITRELKEVYEYVINISLTDKIGFPLFVKILALLGYLNSTVTSNLIMPSMSPKEEQLVVLAWQSVRIRGTQDTLIVGNQEFAQFRQDDGQN